MTDYNRREGRPQPRGVIDSSRDEPIYVTLMQDVAVAARECHSSESIVDVARLEPLTPISEATSVAGTMAFRCGNQVIGGLSGKERSIKAP
jgi:hypothetical protein